MNLNIKILVIILAFLSFVIVSVNAQTTGCTDPKANNFNLNAKINDGSCRYNETFSDPVLLASLPLEISETSGMIFFNGYLWTHNDSGGEAVLYAINPNTGSIIKRVFIANAPAKDWEDIAMDDEFVFVGDFGNNNGTRTDLSIVKFPLSELNQDTAYATVMKFSYMDQIDFSSQPENNNYDAEAMMALGDSLYVFSKNWNNLKSRIYSLPKTFSNYSAQVVDSLSSNGMITGADYLKEEKVTVLCGYNKLLQPFIYLLWDFENKKISQGNQRKINLNIPFHQIEGVAFKSLDQLYLTNESIQNRLLKIKAAVFEMDLTQWIDIANPKDTVQNTKENKLIKLFPNPSKDELNIEWEKGLEIHQIEIYDLSGKYSEVWNLNEVKPSYQIDISNLKNGTYLLKLSGKNVVQYKKFIKQ